MKRLLSMALSAALITGMMAGCSQTAPSSGSEGQGSAAQQSSAPAEKKSITVWYYWDNENQRKVFDKIIEDYNASQSNIEAKTQYVPFADFKKQLSIGATASKLPEVVVLDGVDQASYAAMGIFADLTDKLKDWPDLSQYYEGPLNSCKLDGKLYGLPFGSNCLELFYNEDMLKAANCKVPTTWDELKDVAKKTTKGKVYGMGMCGLQNEEGTFNFMPWLWSTGTTSYEINNDKGVKALTFVSDLVKNGSMSKEVINWTQGDVMHQFISGNLAMMINGPWQVPTMREQAPDLKWNVAPIPKDSQSASVLGGENFGVINGPNVDASIDFLKFATSANEVKSYIDKFGYIASRKDVAATQFTGDAIMKAFVDGMQNAQPRGPHPNWPTISDAISLAVNESVTGASTPAAAAEKAQKTIDGAKG